MLGYREPPLSLVDAFAVESDADAERRKEERDMPGFLGYRSVLSALRAHVRGTGKVTDGVLKLRGTGDSFTSVTWKKLYVWPESEASGFAASGYPTIQGTITLWRTGEASKPRVDDQITVSTNTYLIQTVETQRNADEVRNYAVYVCGVVRS